jgi:hypothetical protein
LADVPRGKTVIGCLGVAVVVLLLIGAALFGLGHLFRPQVMDEERVAAPESGLIAVLITYGGGGAAGSVYSDLFIQSPDGARLLVPRDASDDASFMHWSGPRALSVCMDSPIVSQRVRLTDQTVIDIANECPPHIVASRRSRAANPAQAR